MYSVLICLGHNTHVLLTFYILYSQYHHCGATVYGLHYNFWRYQDRGWLVGWLSSGLLFLLLLFIVVRQALFCFHLVFRLLKE